MLFFLRGQTDTKILEDKKITIWSGNTSRDFLDKRGLSHLPEGDMGRGYGHQMRNFGGTDIQPGFDQLPSSLQNRQLSYLPVHW
jgi:thymidylate synthase